jgi:hypothetical protein
MAVSRAAGRATAQPRSDVYTVLLAISFTAMLVGCVLLYLDYSQYGGKKPPDLPVAKPPAAAQPSR